MDHSLTHSLTSAQLQWSFYTYHDHCVTDQSRQQFTPDPHTNTNINNGGLFMAADVVVVERGINHGDITQQLTRR